MEISSDIIDRLKRLDNEKKDDIEQLLRKKLQEIEKQQKVLADILEYHKKDWILHFIYSLQELIPVLQKSEIGDKDFFNKIEIFRKNACDSVRQTFNRFPGLFEKACKEAGLAIDKESRHPKYLFESGFLTLTISETKSMATISDYEGKLSELPADIPAIIESLKVEHNRLFSGPFKADKFLKTLRLQYKALIGKEKRKDGDPIQIRHLTTRMGKNIKGFRTDEFLVALSKLAKESSIKIDGRKLELQQTKDTKQGMLLYGAAERGYIGFILFKEA